MLFLLPPFFLILFLFFFFHAPIKIFTTGLIQRLKPRRSPCDFPPQRLENPPDLLENRSTSSSFSYDVFLSFRGKDTRHGFTGHLYKALRVKGIRTFIDDEELQSGNQITPSLLKAIQESKIAIVVLSKNYASSSFCLDELVHILHNQIALVLPVFYKVDPSDVRHERGNYGEALTKHENKYKVKSETLEKWKIALRQVAGFSGWHFKPGVGYEYKLIESIVGEVSNKINCAPLHVADYPVGLQWPLWQVKSLLYDGLDDGVCMVGIHGIGGIGKTTLARAVCNLVSHQFEALCFLEDVRKKELVNLQETILSKIIGETDIQLGSVNQGISILKHRLGQKKVLLVLDDVDGPEQLRSLVGRPDWFGIGSKVIITTRDKHLLTSHAVQRTYEVQELNVNDALELLSWNAFKSIKVDPSYKNSLKRAVTYASGLPLALAVVGSNLFGKKIKEWESALDQYGRIPNKEIQKILQLSFDSLEECQQKLFLDIACFFNVNKLLYVKEILYAHHGSCPEYGIGVLIEKSLIKIDSCNRLRLHDLIEDMGKEIVRQESPEEPGERSRLWIPDDIIHVLEKNVGTRKIQIIILKWVHEEVEWDGEAFKEMENLKTLIIRGVYFSEGPKHLPNSLRVLEWQGYPSPSLPSDFYPRKLFKLDLPHSCLTSIELFGSKKKKFVNLTALNINYSPDIIEIPDVSGVPYLESLSFQGCRNLIKIHESVGFLDKLRELNADNCKKLRTFPDIKLSSLAHLGLSDCESLERFPEILGNMEKLIKLSIWGSGVNELPFSIHYLIRLEHLHLNTTYHMKRKYNLSHELLSKILTWPAHLTKLDLSGDNFTTIPASIKECLRLKHISLSDCNLLRKIEGTPPNLEELSVHRCISLKVLDLSLLPPGTNECRLLRKLNVYGCENLEEIIGIPSNLEELSVCNCISLKVLDLSFLPPGTNECRLLRKLDVHWCENLEKIIGIPSNVDELSVCDCISLKVVDLSLLPPRTNECRLLRKLHVYWCKNLEKIIGIPSNLEELFVEGCISLKVLDLSLLLSGTNECRLLRKLRVYCCENLEEIIGIPSNLEELSVDRCISMKVLDLSLLPSGTNECRLFRKLSVNGCKNLEEIIGIPSNLKELFVYNCISMKVLDLSLLPPGTNECRLLRKLDVYDCENLEEIIGIPSNLEELYVDSCISLKVLDLSLLPPGTNECRLLRKLHVYGCENLEEIIGIPSNFEHLFVRNCKSLNSRRYDSDSVPALVLMSGEKENDGLEAS